MFFWNNANCEHGMPLTLNMMTRARSDSRITTEEDKFEWRQQKQFFKDHHDFFFFSSRLTKHSSLGQMNLSTHNLKTKKARITKISSLICYPWQSFLVDINSFKVESGDIFSSYFNIRFRTFFDLYFTISTKAVEFCCFR